MKLKKAKSVNHVFHAAMLPTAVLSVGLTMPASMVHATIAQPEEIVVTARRTEEVLQNVPISMTVFNQDMLTERNVSSGADLATYTPSLAVNTRFGADQTTFAIRGFTQELRTTASVAVYFADVVAPRGGGSITTGDGAGPGAFFDLQNVQVLKGPQGTLFGRNTTGGAIQLVPQEPTSKFGGYLEQSLGNYNMRRTQGVLNIPITSDIRARFGVDMQKRDGYLINMSDVGPSRFADKDYVTGRASLMWDITNSISNYTILTHTSSENNGSVTGLFACDPSGAIAFLCEPFLAAQGHGFYHVSNDVSTLKPISKLTQTQFINTTTWEINDNFTLKNNLAHAHLEQTTRSPFFGISLNLGGENSFFPGGQKPGTPSNSQNTLVEELQLSGAALNGDLTWQSGLYFEHSTPDGMTGALAPALINCNWPLGDDFHDWVCPSSLGGNGSVNSNLGQIEYTNKAVYTQGTYEFSDEFRVTLGVRYTVDDVESKSKQKIYTFDGSGLVTGIDCANFDASPVDCSQKLSKRSEAPTWLIDFDYLPTPDVLVYAKYARGYRQGSVVAFAPAGIQEYDPEKVDAYEIGAKTTFRGPIPGTFNISAFYNELKDQQLQAQYVPCSLNPAAPACVGYSGPAGSPTTAILNAGASTIQGVDVETTLKLLESLSFNLSYTYLQTHLDSLADAPQSVGYSPALSSKEGGHLSFSPTHSVTAGLSYELPVPADLGDVSAGATYTFVSDQLSAIGSPFGVLPSHRSLNLNMGWKDIVGSSFDASLFMTNALNEKTTTYVPGVYDGFGMEFRVVGEPRMWGARVKYNFGK